MISIVIPIFNEEDIIGKLYEDVRAAIEKIGEKYELLFVDDGSTDRSLSRLLELRENDKRVKIVQLSRNFGHQPAYTAGLELARGEYVIMMDGDLQDPPELIPKLFEKIADDDLDMVHAVRTERRENFLKATLIKTFHYIFSKVSDLPIHGNVGNFCIMNRQSLDALLSIKERHRYLPGLRFFIGFRQGTVEYVRPERTGGKAKMDYPRLASLAMDAIFAFTSIPIRICLILGGFGIVFFLVGAVIVFIKKIIGVAILGWTSILLSIYFFGSVQLFFLGILGEYVFRIHKETQKRPLFIVRQFHD